MTKLIIVCLIVIGVFYAAREIFREAAQKTVPVPGETREVKPAAPQVLPGMPDNFEPALAAAQKGGPAVFKAWIAKYRSFIADPRLADIELDYVVSVGRQDPAEAKRVFQSVKSRVPPNSPVYDRVKRLAGTFE